jgi:ankyrin repeat protein
MTELQDPESFQFSRSVIFDYCRDEDLVQRIYKGEETLARSEIEKRIADVCDYYHIYDWGRDFEIDNASRVKNIDSFISSNEFKRVKFDYLNPDNYDPAMRSSRCCIFYLTDRFLRRIREKTMLKVDYDILRHVFPVSKVILVLMEKRVEYNLRWYLKELNLPSDTVAINCTEPEEPLEIVGHRVFTALQQLIPVNVAKLQRFVELTSKAAIFNAVSQGNLPLLKTALELKYSRLSDKNNDDIPILFLSVLNNQMDVLRFFIENGVDLNVLDSQKNTILHYVCFTQNSHMMVYLLTQKTVKVNVVNKDGSSPLHIAAKVGFVAGVRLLTEKNASLTLSNRSGQTPQQVALNEEIDSIISQAANDRNVFFSAVQNDDVEKVSDLLKQPGTAINWINEDGRSALYFACEKERKHSFQMIKLLLEAEADVNLKDNWGCIALSTAIVNQSRLEVIQLLVEAKSEINYFNSWGNSPLFEACQSDKLEVAKYLISMGADLTTKGSYYRAMKVKSLVDVVMLKNNIPLLNLLLNKGAPVGMELLTDLLEFEFSLDYSAFAANQFSLWFSLLQVNGNSKVESVISSAIQRFPKLLFAKDSVGRMTNAIATDKNKAIINSYFLWHGKYRPTQTKPEHCSATSFVFKAVDLSEIDENGEPKSVAIKLMRFKSHFLKEIRSREEHQLNNDTIIQVIEHFPREENIDSAPEDAGIVEVSGSAISKSEAESLFCIVMTLADRNMFVSFKQERFAGRDYSMVREIFRQLTVCTQYLHERGVLHGDIKPLNIMRVDSFWKLIDLDASCRMGIDPVCSKYSTGYCPPEAIHINKTRTVAFPKSPVTAMDEQEEKYSLLIARPSFDIWSLGCVLYQLCSKDTIPLFSVGQDDNLSDDMKREDNLFVLADWSKEEKEKRLEFITNPLARNLLSVMLQKDPTKRLPLSHVLTHPFISGKTTARLPDSPPSFDIFLSYREASDVQLATSIYNCLIKKGLKVWWDKRCLPVGKNWKESFCAGLLNSGSFLCLLSKNGVYNSNVLRQDFSRLEESSDCDNVLLEIRLALELKESFYLDRIIPVMVGDYDELKFEKYDWERNFPHGNDVVVKRLEESLTEELEIQGLGCSMLSSKPSSITVKGLLTLLMVNHGVFLQGEKEKAIEELVENIAKMVLEQKQK